EPDLRVVGSGLCRRSGADRGDARSATAPFDSGCHSGRELSPQGQAPRWRAEDAGSSTEHASTGMTRSLPRWVHRNLPRAAPPDSWRSLRSARVPPMHYLDKLPRPRLGAGKTPGSELNRRTSPKRVRIQPALTMPQPAIADRGDA